MRLRVVSRGHTAPGSGQGSHLRQPSRRQEHTIFYLDMCVRAYNHGGGGGGGERGDAVSQHGGEDHNCGDGRGLSQEQMRGTNTLPS